jgi:hypothetical protein
MWYSVASGTLSASFIPHRGHTPGLFDRTSGSMGHTQTCSCGHSLPAAASIASDADTKDRLCKPFLGTTQ